MIYVISKNYCVLYYGIFYIMIEAGKDNHTDTFFFYPFPASMKKFFGDIAKQLNG